MPSKPKSEYSIQTVSNALRILESFYPDRECGVSELGRRLGLHKNNVFRLLATLEEHGYVEQCAENERYRLGSRCLQLGQAYLGGQTFLERARPIIRELAYKLGETAHIAVLQDFEVVHLDGAASDRLLTTALRVGTRLPPHCTALGKVLLGCAQLEVREAFTQRGSVTRGLIPRTESSHSELGDFLAELEGVKNQAHAIDREECELGMNCVAAPVWAADGQLLAAISVSGPVSRLSKEVLAGEAARAVTAAGAQLSADLGYRF